MHHVRTYAPTRTESAHMRASTTDVRTRMQARTDHSDLVHDVAHRGLLLLWDVEAARPPGRNHFAAQLGALQALERRIGGRGVRK